MKVKELIRQLQGLNPELEVLVQGHSLGFYHGVFGVHAEPYLNRRGVEDGPPIALLDIDN